MAELEAFKESMKDKSVNTFKAYLNYYCYKLLLH